MIPYEWFISAANRIEDHINHTPITFDSDLGVYFKWENKQKTGSFKVRGAVNRVILLESWELQQGLVTAKIPVGQPEHRPFGDGVALRHRPGGAGRGPLGDGQPGRRRP